MGTQHIAITYQSLLQRRYIKNLLFTENDKNARKSNILNILFIVLLDIKL